MFGLLNVCKPPGPTSHDVVAGVRRQLGRRVKVGHAGTLDPFAEGVLVLCVGPATRLAEYVQARPKRYRAVVRLGATSTTLDPEGEITPAPGAPAPTADDVREALARFVGTIEQVPPAHSAVHVAGRRAYELARAGRPVELPPRTVTIHSIDLLRCEHARVEIDVCCGSGTYLRALARDVAAALGTAGYCERLTRTAIGDFRIADAIPPDRLDPVRDLLAPLLAVSHLPQVTIGDAQREDLRNGRPWASPEILDSEAVAIIDGRGGLLALAGVRGDRRTLQPTKVFFQG